MKGYLYYLGLSRQEKAKESQKERTMRLTTKLGNKEVLDLLLDNKIQHKTSKVCLHKM